MKTILSTGILAMLLMLSLSGCASLQGVRTEKIDHRQVEYILAGHGAQTVVFENGLGATVEQWANVFPEISEETTLFAYNRPGYGKSDPVTTPRDGTHIVDELRSLLRSKGLKPPYVLVGHSLGGLYMQLFARRYPGEVSALVLVDATHPEQFKGKGSPEHWSGWLRVGFDLWLSEEEKKEFDAANATGESVLALPSYAGGPVVVLSALEPMKETSEVAEYANEMRRDTARLYPGCKQVWVQSGHNIPLQKPEAVIAAIRGVL